MRWLLLSLLLSVPLFAQRNNRGWMEELGVREKIYNASLITSDSSILTIQSLYQENPVIVALVFSRCTGICYPFLLKLKENLELLDIKESIQVLVISFDPRDTSEDMKRMASFYDLDKNPNWIFAVTTEIDSLINSAYFYPVWNEQTGQFDHDGLLIGLNRDGTIVKKLLGFRSAVDVMFLIRSMQNIFRTSYKLPGKNSLFSCFSFDPETGEARLGLGFLLLVIPSFLTVLGLIVLNWYLHKKRLSASY